LECSGQYCSDQNFVDPSCDLLDFDQIVAYLDLGHTAMRIVAFRWQSSAPANHFGHNKHAVDHPDSHIGRNYHFGRSNLERTEDFAQILELSPNYSTPEHMLVYSGFPRNFHTGRILDHNSSPNILGCKSGRIAQLAIPIAAAPRDLAMEFLYHFGRYFACSALDLDSDCWHIQSPVGSTKAASGYLVVGILGSGHTLAAHLG
jgi:hypothetical protein